VPATQITSILCHLLRGWEAALMACGAGAAVVDALTEGQGGDSADCQLVLPGLFVGAVSAVLATSHHASEAAFTHVLSVGPDVDSLWSVRSRADHAGRAEEHAELAVTSAAGASGEAGALLGDTALPFSYAYVPALDMPHVDLLSHAPRMLAFVVEACSTPRSRVAIVCEHGHSRSGAAAAMVLMLAGSLRAQTALALVRAGRPSVQPNAGFVYQLQLLERLLTGGQAGREGGAGCTSVASSTHLTPHGAAGNSRVMSRAGAEIPRATPGAASAAYHLFAAAAARMYSGAPTAGFDEPIAAPDGTAVAWNGGSGFLAFAGAMSQRILTPAEVGSLQERCVGGMTKWASAVDGVQPSAALQGALAGAWAQRLLWPEGDLEAPPPGIVYFCRACNAQLVTARSVVEYHPQPCGLLLLQPLRWMVQAEGYASGDREGGLAVHTAAAASSASSRTTSCTCTRWLHKVALQEGGSGAAGSRNRGDAVPSRAEVGSCADSDVQPAHSTPDSGDSHPSDKNFLAAPRCACEAAELARGLGADADGAWQGRLVCPNARCGVKLGGGLRWEGLRCACGRVTGPALYVNAARVTARAALR
jgi:predicted protein tyrosine phosphatase